LGGVVGGFVLAVHFFSWNKKAGRENGPPGKVE
jgi:hypothetical protein